jgi:hypothetical protein
VEFLTIQMSFSSIQEKFPSIRKGFPSIQQDFIKNSSSRSTDLKQIVGKNLVSIHSQGVSIHSNEIFIHSREVSIHSQGVSIHSARFHQKFICQVYDFEADIR